MKHYPQIVYANAKNLANFFALQTVHFTQSKGARGAVGVPMPYPLISSFEELSMFGTFIESFADGSFALNLPKMIDYFVFEYANQPGSLRSPPFKFLVSLQRREKRLLHGVFGSGIVTKSEARVLEKIVAVIVQPSARVGS